MSKNFPLEDFKDAVKNSSLPDVAASQTQILSAQDVETLKAQTYELGYQAGWDDATTEQAKDHHRIGADLAKNLQDLGFTFHEARAHVLRALEPLLDAVFSKILPGLATDSIALIAQEHLLDLAKNATDGPITILVSAANKLAVEKLVAAACTTPVSVVEEPTLGDGQVTLRAGKSERQIDLDDTINQMRSALSAFSELNSKDIHYG